MWTINMHPHLQLLDISGIYISIARVCCDTTSEATGSHYSRFGNNNPEQKLIEKSSDVTFQRSTARGKLGRVTREYFYDSFMSARRYFCCWRFESNGPWYFYENWNVNKLLWLLEKVSSLFFSFQDFSFIP